jgi:hypothetical protein
LEINMVFQLPQEFMLPEPKMARLMLGAKRAVFEKPQAFDQHMKSLYIRGHLDGVPVNRMLMDGGACVNIMLASTFEKLEHKDGELMKMNMMLSGFSGKASEARGIISKELMVRSKIIPITFFVVNITRRYNILLGRDWIHTNGCMPSTLHQCVISDEVEVVGANDSTCVAMAETQGDLQHGEVRCLSGHDLSSFDFISMGHGGFVPVNAKLMAINWLVSISSQDNE